MPHQQVRVAPALSPANLDAVLRVIADAGVDIKGISGSYHEITGGEVGFLLRDADIPTVMAALETSGYRPRRVRKADGLHADIVEHREGGLLEAMGRARAQFPRGVVIDIAVGLDDLTLMRGPDGALLEEGETVAGAVEVTGKPVQVYFNVPVGRDDRGVVIE